MNTTPPKVNKLAELIALAKKQSAPAPSEAVVIAAPPAPTHPAQQSNAPIVLNSNQRRCVELAASGSSLVLIGAAGTGKTTCMKETVQALVQSGRIPMIPSTTHKYLVEGTPGIILTSFTRRAVANVRKAVPADLRANCITIHKLLEYRPTPVVVYDETTGNERESMHFLPHRNAINKLPAAIHTIIIDEASMVSKELFAEILDALEDPSAVQFIFLGDINQLPPVFGSAVLGYKMQELPVIELTEVYRQALESPIIRLAHRALSGEPIPASEYPDWKHPGLTLHPWKKSISADNALLTFAGFFKAALDTRSYNPEEDMILIPFNKSCGTIELNKHIANHIARTAGATTHEVIAGFNKHYFTVGDRILYEKEDAQIVAISHNALYSGATPTTASSTLDYWGYDSGLVGAEHTHHIQEQSEEDIDALLDSMATLDSSERLRQSSHIITIRILESDQEVTLDTAAEINSLLLSYALTVHKSQGSEWRKVFLCLHRSHATMLQRELLYTAVTRAREELYVICEPDTFTKGIINQKIKGNTLAEKAEYFKGKITAASSNNRS